MADYVPPSVAEKRVRYFDGQFLQDQDFIDEQDYQLDREHRHNRLLHGPGIADGLAVTSAAPNQVTVAPGTAIDSDGHQLVLAQATTVDLPASEFNDKQGVELLISYLESAEDPQTVGGSQDFTRWLERPALTALGPGDSYSGTAPPVLLAKVALDHSGRVAVDNSVRSYAGLRLPGAAADAATLRATGGGPVDLAGSLTVDGSLGVGTASPENDLEVGAFQPQDRYLAFKVQGGNAHRSGVKMWAWQDNYGYSIQYDERNQTGNGLHIKTHNVNADGVTQMFVSWGGSVGIGTTSPGAKLEVAGAGGTSVDLLVNGRLKSNNNDGGLWVASDRFVGGFDTNKIGFWNNGLWRLAVLNTGNVGIATTSPEHDLEVGNFDNQDRYLAFKVQGGNAHRSGVKMWAWQDNYGYSIQYDERNQTGNGLHIKTHNVNADGVTQMFVSWGGSVGIGTTSPGAKLEVHGGGGSSIDLTVNGRLQSNNNDGGLWVASDRFVGGFDTNKVGFWNGSAWRLAVLPGGNVGIGTTSPEHDLEVGNFDNQDRYLAFKVQGGNAHRSGVKLWAWQDNYGYSIQHDERNLPQAGLHIKTHNRDVDGTTRLFVGWDGGVAIGTTNTNGQAFSVVGSTWLQGDLFVGGRLVYWWGPDRGWKVINNRAFPALTGTYAGSDPSGGPSDVRLKTDLRPISHALDLVRKLRGVRYRWGDGGLAHFTRDIEGSVFAGPEATDAQNHQAGQAERRRALDTLAGDRLGLVAQDVEPVVPELVHEDADGYKHIRYQHLTALLTEAIKEQDAVVRTLSSEVAALRARLSGQTAR